MWLVSRFTIHLQSLDLRSNFQPQLLMCPMCQLLCVKYATVKLLSHSLISMPWSSELLKPVVASSVAFSYSPLPTFTFPAQNKQLTRKCKQIHSTIESVLKPLNFWRKLSSQNHYGNYKCIVWYKKHSPFWLTPYTDKGQEHRCLNFLSSYTQT